MATFATDQAGKAWVRCLTPPDASGDRLEISFSISGDHGIPFPPLVTVELDDARLDVVVAGVAEMAGFGPLERVP